MSYRMIDLCAGIGGIRRGFELAGDYENVISAEIDEAACKTYEHLFGDDPRNDVTKDEFKNRIKNLPYDVLLAGFPCQAFSSAGLKLGFEDTTKGTIFFDIAKIIKETNPKVVFLENVENLITHDSGNTFKTITKTLNNELNYKIVGISENYTEDIKFPHKSFVRNSKDFGVPQNRPRVYIIAFSRSYFGEHIKLIPDVLPLNRPGKIFDTLSSVLDKKVEARYFLSSGYLDTLENHILRQKENGNGFGYRIVNSPETKNPIANTLMATGGSGKERNLIYDKANGKKYAGQNVKGKQSPINEKFVRTMTPVEWGRLQGFIGYAFLDENGHEKFSFPEGVSVTQQYKQFGNSVTIPVVEQMALFVKNCINIMTNEFSEIERKLFALYGEEFTLCRSIYLNYASKSKEKTILKYIDLVTHYGCGNEFKASDAADFMGCTEKHSSYVLNKLKKDGYVVKGKEGKFVFDVGLREELLL